MVHVVVCLVQWFIAAVPMSVFHEIFPSLQLSTDDEKQLHRPMWNSRCSSRSKSKIAHRLSLQILQ